MPHKEKIEQCLSSCSRQQQRRITWLNMFKCQVNYKSNIANVLEAEVGMKQGHTVREYENESAGHGSE